MTSEVSKGLFSQICDGLLHLVYPKVCVGCGRDLPGQGQLICLDCLDTLPLTNFHLQQHNPVEKMFLGRMDIVAAASYLYFAKQSAVQRILHQLKYQGNKEVGRYFGRSMGRALRESDIYNGIEGLIPLPLHDKKEKKRGYNQAMMICEGMAEVMHVPVLSGVVRRTMATDTQTSKNRMQRWANMEGKFIVGDEKKIEDKYLLLVDDVLTTGATLEACGTALLKVKNVKLGIFTLAYSSS